MPAGLNRKDLNRTQKNFRLGTPITLPHNFGNVFPKTATITAVNYAAPLLSVTATHDFYPDDAVTLSGLTTNVTLNGRTAGIVGVDGGLTFTVSIPGLTITNGADTGTATKALPNNFIPSGGNEVNAVNLPKNFGNSMNLAIGN